MTLVAIVGRPNTGKSTLFNRLAGARRALVDDLPGVTRDLHFATVTWHGRTFSLVDTGGISTETGDQLIERVVEQVDFAITEASAIVFLLDGRDGLTSEDEEIADRLRRTRKPVFYAVNKTESPRVRDEAADFYRLGADHLHFVSAKENLGVQDLFHAVLDAVPGELDEPLPEDDGRVRVAIVGKPNVGKSSLINRLIGSSRLIVADLPGTTRDAIDVPLEVGDRRYVFVDTAGIRRKAKVTYRLEKFSVVKALEALDRCHVAVVLGDATEWFSDQMLRITGYAIERGRAVIWAFNKIDLVEDVEAWRKELRRQIDFRLEHLAFVPIVEVSARTGRGVKKLFPLIDRVDAAHNRRIDTGPLNRIFEDAIARHSPPIVKNRPLKFYFATQPRTRPPSFVAFTNAPEAVHFSYERFLLRQIREADDFTGTPIRLEFRARKRRDFVDGGDKAERSPAKRSKGSSDKR